jgi:hydroxypyruvate reductase
MVKSLSSLHADAARIWAAALEAVDPEAAVRKFLKRDGSMLRIDGRRYDLARIGKLWVLGAGKASAPMGRAVEKILGRYLAGGFLVTKYGHSLGLNKLEIAEAGHPLPDRNSVAAAAKIADLAKNQVGPDDLVLCLFSGGASSLMVRPAPGFTLEDKLACTRLMLNAGADIREMNAVRKHLSGIKGGRMAEMVAPAAAVSLILSDVVGDDPGTIASGPMTPDATTFADGLEIFEKLGISDRVPRAVMRRFREGAAGRIPETPKADDPVFRRCESFIVANNAQACAAACRAARRLGYHAMVLTSRLEGDTKEAARLHMSVASEIVFHRRPLRRPACIISGGETTVRVTGKGSGGRNQEFALHCVRHLAGLPAPVLAASLGTDGTDGPTDAAGAVADSTTLLRSMKFGARFLEASAENNDSHSFFKRLGDLIVTGPTRTNVMDLHIVLIG